MANGSPVDRAFKEAIQTTGQAVNTILTDRFHRKQFEDFQKTVVSSFHEQQTNILQAIAETDDPDETKQHFLNYKNTVNSFMTATSDPKWAGNPYIAEVGQRTFNAANQGLTDFMTLESDISEQEAAATEAASVQDLRTAQAGKERALAGKYRAETRQIGKEAEEEAYPGFVPPSQRSSLASVRTALNNPEFAEQRATEIGEMITQEAQRIVQQRAAAGMQRKDPTTFQEYTWGEREADFADAAREVNRQQVVKAWERKRLQTEGIDPDDPKFGGHWKILEPSPKGEMPATMGLRSEADVSRQLLGGGAALTNILGEGWKGWSAEKIVKKLPEDLTAIRNTAIGEVFGQVADSGGYIQTRKGPRAPKDVAELKSYFEQIGEAEIRNAFGGYEVDDKDLDNLTRRTRERARKLLRASIDKYGNQIAKAIFGKDFAGQAAGADFVTPLLRAGRGLQRGAEAAKEALGGFLTGLGGEEEL